MTKMLEKIVVEMSTLPAEAQEQLGGELLDRINDWRALKADIDEGIAAAERGELQRIDPREFIRQALARHAAR
jgi:hypothetical protein